MYTTDSADYIRFVLLPAAKERLRASSKKYAKAKAAGWKPKHSFLAYDDYLNKKIALLEKRNEEQDKEISENDKLISEWDEWERKNRAGNLCVVFKKNIDNSQNM